MGSTTYRYNAVGTEAMELVTYTSPLLPPTVTTLPTPYQASIILVYSGIDGADLQIFGGGPGFQTTIDALTLTTVTLPSTGDDEISFRSEGLYGSIGSLQLYAPPGSVPSDTLPADLSAFTSGGFFQYTSPVPPDTVELWVGTAQGYIPDPQAAVVPEPASQWLLAIALFLGLAAVIWWNRDTFQGIEEL